MRPGDVGGDRFEVERLASIQRLAACISDDTLRRSFIENLPHHRLIARLAGA
jgi:hypothetical protein